MNGSPTLADVLALASVDGRVCPKPPAWSALYERLPDTRQDSYGAIPPRPLVLAAWAQTGDEQKRQRLIEHLEWAARHGALAAVFAFLAGLREDQWHHVGD